ncbi:MAG TPA: site-2 protease family protein [Reyranellaceae bacterium]|nr:site-2 protease family protein [Reyranellaceae bacterium]
MDIAALVYTASTWVLPVLFAITLHEAAHGFVAMQRGDGTAWMMGRVTINPLKHIDPFGTVALPGLLLLLGSPFLFGYAKPVPVNARQLRNPRYDMALVAAAGPTANILMAVIAALLAHTVGVLPPDAAKWLGANFTNALIFNVALAALNLLPLPTLDGGRIAASLLPRPLGEIYDRLEPHGLLIVFGLFVILPLIAQQLGTRFDPAAVVLSPIIREVTLFIVTVTGHG